MAHKTSVPRFSVGPALAREYERLAEREGITKSDLFRRMVTTYKAEREEQSLSRFSGRWPAVFATLMSTPKRRLNVSYLRTVDEGGL